MERKAAGPPKGKEKEEKDPADAPLSPMLLQGLVNTIMFTTLYLKFNPKDKSIQKHLERWAELDKTKKIGGLLPSATEVIRVLGVMKEETTAIPALNTIVMSCLTLRTGKEFQELEKCACVDDRNVPDAENCFFFSFLRQAIVVRIVVFFPSFLPLFLFFFLIFSCNSTQICRMRHHEWPFSKPHT